MKNAVSSLKTGLCFISNVYADIFRLTRHPREGLKWLYGISLYRNAVHVMTHSAVTAILALALWGVAASFDFRDKSFFGILEIGREA